MFEDEEAALGRFFHFENDFVANGEEMGRRILESIS